MDEALLLLARQLLTTEVDGERLEEYARQSPENRDRVWMLGEALEKAMSTAKYAVEVTA